MRRWIALAYFLSAFFLIAFSKLITVSTVVASDARSVDENAPLLIDHWKTWLINWKAHAVSALAIIILFIPLFSYFRCLWLRITRQGTQKTPQ